MNRDAPAARDGTAKTGANRERVRASPPVRQALVLAGTVLAAAMVSGRTSATDAPAATLVEAGSSNQATMSGPTMGASGAQDGPRPDVAAPGSGSTFTLRVRGVDVHNLITFVARSRGRCLLVGPEVTGTVSMDAEKSSMLEIQDEAVRASRAAWVATGNMVVLGDAGRVAAASGSPLQPLLARSLYKGRRVSLFFVRVPVTDMLRLLAHISKRPFEIAEGIEETVTIGANEVPWTEILDSLALACNLTRQEFGRTIRVSRRGDPAPRFVALGPYTNTRTPPDGGPEDCPPPLGDLEPNDLKVVGTLTGPLAWGPEAFVRLPNGELTVLRRDSCVGSSGAVVVRVERNRVVLEQRVHDAAWDCITVTERTMELRGSEEEPRTER